MVSQLVYQINIANLIGTIQTSDKLRFKQLVFRVSRGNALVNFKDLKNAFTDNDGKDQFKSVYIVVFQEGTIMRERLMKLCDGFDGKRFEMPEGGIQHALI